MLINTVFLKFDTHYIRPPCLSIGNFGEFEHEEHVFHCCEVGIAVLVACIRMTENLN